MKQTFVRRRGQGMTEYIIIVGLIAILLVGAVSKFKDALQGAFQGATDTIKTQVTAKIPGAEGHVPDSFDPDQD